MNHCRKVNRVTVRKRGLEFDLLCSPRGRLVQTVAQALNYSIHLHLTTRRRKHYFQQNLTFQVQLDCLRRIHRPRFGQDDYRLDRRRVVQLLFWRLDDLIIRVGEPGGLDRSALLPARWRDGHSISESCTGNNSTLACSAARAVPIAGTGRQCWIAKSTDICSLFLVAWPCV